MSLNWIPIVNVVDVLKRLALPYLNITSSEYMEQLVHTVVSVKIRQIKVILHLELSKTKFWSKARKIFPTDPYF